LAFSTAKNILKKSRLPVPRTIYSLYKGAIDFPEHNSTAKAQPIDTDKFSTPQRCNYLSTGDPQ